MAKSICFRQSRILTKNTGKDQSSGGFSAFWDPGAWLQVGRKFLATNFAKTLVVGYMDPGNWATDLSAGSQFGYRLLFAVLFSSFCAMFLQMLTAKLGVVTGQDLPTLCRKHFSASFNSFLYITAEIAIIACDIAEVENALI
jgi:NRAMP (natural resistance-associated macrophage protein)-like metal ion transporter